MLHLDTNILIRILTNTPRRQANKIFLFLKKTTQDLHLSSLVILETFQVLTGKVYDFSHSQTASALIDLINTERFEVQDEEIHLQALEVCKTKKLDYTDAFLVALNKQTKGKVLSFDKDFDKINKKIRLKPG